MTERDKLIEVMARAIADANHGTLIWELYADDARMALDAAEREGWQVTRLRKMLEDGR